MVSERTSPNTRLAAVMKLAGATNKGLARRVRLLSETDGQGDPVRADHVAVKRWLDGATRHPHPRTCRLIACALGEMLDRTVSLEEIGYAEQAAPVDDVGLDYPEEVAHSIAALGAITDLELRLPSRAAPLAVVPEAWSGIVMRWLMDGDTEQSRPPAEPRPVTVMDVEAVRSATEMFSTYDYKFGGGRPKSMVASFLDTEVMPHLAHASPNDPVGREYFREVAALTRLAGWTAYDIGAHGLVRQHRLDDFGWSGGCRTLVIMDAAAC